MTPKQGRHKAKSRTSQKIAGLFSKFKRKLIFGSIGIFVMLVGYATLFVCVDVLHWSPSVAYAIQAVVSIELNFVLNYKITWRDRRDTSFWSMLGRFHVSRIVTIPLNQVIFNALVWVHVNYLIANTLCIILVTVFNYVVGDKFTFRKAKTSIEDAPKEAVVLGKAL